jgi:23S rRNA pseudouridine1911/1915/1917 synthase
MLVIASRGKMKSKSKLIFETKYTATTPGLLREFLKAAAQLSGRSLRTAFFKGQIKLNRRPAHSEAMVKNGDLVQVYAGAEYTETLTPEPQPIAIIYENEQLLVLNKPALLPVHPSGKITSGTLANRVAAYFQQQNLPIKVRPVNRLDYGTSGLIIFAKSAAIQAQLSKTLQEHRIKRIYYCLVQGNPNPESGIIRASIGQIRGRRCIAPNGQAAETAYRIIRRFRDASLLELELKTGRTHQIRIHLAHIGCPLLGDPTYGIKSAAINRPALHAGKLIFNTEAFKVPELTTPLPEDMEKLINSLELRV